jgi:preprotein translocase subunit SecG
MGIVIGLLSLGLVLVCCLLGLLILVQLPKKEAGLGMAFGSGAVDTLLGAGAGNALTRFTKWSAGIFLALCIVLAWLYNSQASTRARSKGVRQAAQTAAAASATTPATSPTPGISSLVAPAPATNTSTNVLTVPKVTTNSAAGAK